MLGKHSGIKVERDEKVSYRIELSRDRAECITHQAVRLLCSTSEVKIREEYADLYDFIVELQEAVR